MFPGLKSKIAEVRYKQSKLYLNFLRLITIHLSNLKQETLDE